MIRSKHDFLTLFEQVTATNQWDSLFTLMVARFVLYSVEKKMNFGSKDAQLDNRALQIMSTRLLETPEYFPTIFKLDGNNVSDLGAGALADVLVRVGANLRAKEEKVGSDFKAPSYRLNLEGNQVTFEGVLHILEACFRDNAPIKALNLSDQR